MAALSQADRDKVFRAIQREWSRLRDACNFTKTDLTAALNATDDWIDTNQTAFNLALPINFRTNTTLAQKTLLFVFVAVKRASRNNADED